MAANSGLTVSIVQTYVEFRALDVIGNGSYRKYVNTAKDKEDGWAKTILHKVNLVTQCIKTVQSLVVDLQNSRKTALYTLCQTVIENNTPPIDQTTVISDCCVSGKTKCQCIVLKSKGRGAPSLMVQSRFGHFVLMLWTVFKMDLVIKTYTREFLEGIDMQDEDGHPLSMQELSRRLLNENNSIPRLAHALLHALDHVCVSLRKALQC